MTLASAVIIGVEAFVDENIIMSILCILVAAVCVYRIVYYAKGFSSKHEEE
jgi:hypothetical protein